MSSAEFPKTTFSDALKDTKKIKANMKPFLAQYSENNMPWIFQSISILFHNLTNPKTKPLIKMNSMFAVKCIVETCQYAPLSFVEAYIFPIIKAGALVDLEEPEDQRGADYFQAVDGENEDEIINYGYNYVLLCTQLVKVLAVIKPRNLFYDQQVNDQSEYELANLQLRRSLKQNSSQLRFFKEKPSDLNTLYKQKLGEFEQNKLDGYEKFIEATFMKQFKSQFAPSKDGLDIRKLILLGDMFIFQTILENVGGVFSNESPPCSMVSNGLNFISDTVKSGHYGVAIFMHNNDAIRGMVKQVTSNLGENKDLSRGIKYMPNYKGKPEQHQKLYCDFLRNLQFWANTFLQTSLKSASSANEPSNLSKYLQILTKYQFQFPKNPLFESQLKQTEINFNKNRNRNIRLKQEIISQVEPQTDNSIMIMKSMKQIGSKKEVSVPSSSKGKIQQKESIKKEQPKITPSPPPKNESPVKNTKERVKKIERTLELLTQNQRQLPDNMRAIQAQLDQLNKQVQEGDFQENTLNQLIEKQFELNEKLQKIKPAYEQYKANKINYKKFCQIIAPVSSQASHQLQIIKEFDEPSSKINKLPTQEVKMPSRNNIQKQSPAIKSSASIPKQTKPVSANFILEEKVQNQPEIKINSNSRLNQQLIHSKVNFSESDLHQSKFTENLPETHKNYYQEGMNNLQQNYAHETQQARRSQQTPIKQIYYERPEQIHQNSSEISQAINLPNKRFSKQEAQDQERYEYIENPSLNPLENSFHDLEQIYQESRQSKSFKQAISNQKLFIKTNKKQNLFKLSEQCRSIIKPVINGAKTSSRVSSKINVPELLNERSRKYEVEMKLLQENKDKQIRQLMSKLNRMERQNSYMNEELKAKEGEIRSLKENSEADEGRSRAVRSAADQFSLVDDQNYLLKKKFNAPNNSFYNFKKTGENFKNQSRILATGELIDSKEYQRFFCGINDQKIKKMFLKNKELLYKSKQIQIGSIGQLKNGVYSITIFITPEEDLFLDRVKITHEDNLNISHDLTERQVLKSKRQLRKQFQIRVEDYPYEIPQVQLEFTIDGKKQKIQFFLPCAFHKFFIVKNVFDEAEFNREFEGNIVRGEEIPYSRKILKSIDLLQDFLPDLRKLNRGEPNQKGQICFGGQAIFNSHKFPLKISVKPNQFLYIQAITSQNPQVYKLISFYITTLNHFLTKNVDWS